MILYTIIPEEIIFQKQDEASNELTILPRPQLKQYKGELVEVVESNGKQRINRVLSTNPKIFLNKEFSPNNEII